MSTAKKTDWYITGEEVVNCNCAWGCPCQFNALPTYGSCHGWLTCRIEEGHYGEVWLQDVKFSAVASFPGPIHEGNGTMQLIIDEGASPEQRRALEAITSGREGGTIFEIFSAVCPNQQPTLFAPIQLSIDRKKSMASVQIPKIAESIVEPIKNPVSGDAHRAKIVLAAGFEYTEAEMGNTVHFKVTAAPGIHMDYNNCYAQLNRFEWKNT
jgi:hypothetical protein